MVKETCYGVISDVHQDPRVVPEAIRVLKEEGVEKLLVNGDIGNQQKTLEASQEYVGYILNEIGKSGLEAYVQPGSHETLLAFAPVMDYLSSQFSNLIDVTKDQRIDHDTHSLVFLPGTDFFCGGEYIIGSKENIPSGRYVKTDEGLMRFDTLEQYAGALQRGIGKGAMQYANMNDLRGMVDDPDKTIMVCHVPRRFDDVETCVDMAEFGIVTKPFMLGEKRVETGAVFPKPVAYQVVEAGAPVQIRMENRGNEDLRDLYEELGITKAVSGHFHESGHRANDRNGEHVIEQLPVKELFWNSGHLDAGQTGILTVGDGVVSYRNIRLQDYLK